MAFRYKWMAAIHAGTEPVIRKNELTFPIPYNLLEPKPNLKKCYEVTTIGNNIFLIHPAMALGSSRTSQAEMEIIQKIFDAVDI